MKTLLPLTGLLLLGFSNASVGRDYSQEAQACAADNLGAPSVECLEKLFYESSGEITRQENRIVARSRMKQQNDDITNTHHELAATSLRNASAKFKKFSERQCDFAVGYTGAVASDAEQVRWSCLIALNQWRLKYLDDILAAK